MKQERTLPSGALVGEVSDEDHVVWHSEVVPRRGSKPAHIRVSTPVTFELTDLTAGQIQEVLAGQRENRWLLDAIDRDHRER